MPTIHPHIDSETNSILIRLAAQQNETPSAVARKLLQTAVEQTDVGRTVSNLHRRIDELIGRIERLAETQAEALDRAAKTETRIEKLETRIGEIETHMRELRLSSGPLGQIYKLAKNSDATATQILEALTAAAPQPVKK